MHRLGGEGVHQEDGPYAWPARCGTYSFSPSMIAEYVPGVWETATPAQVLDARLRAMDRTLRGLLGDGHLTALHAAGLDACEALVSFAAVGAASVENFAGRGWSDEEWSAARDRLAARGLIDDEGTATPAGRAQRDQVERMTDELAAGPWRALGEAGAERPAELNRPLLGAVFESGLLPAVTTLGIGRIQAPE
ncbi:hypothetical protein ACFYOK_20835 [Microbispora bryophytorum]|uniref:helix-turn-helix domain-containing protein n=1 Tax=Microbispora bryophytorum TaxID=1460882 RepID=UPI003689EFD4